MHKTFASLVGVWSLKRTISGVGTMVGAATFTPINSQELYYYEWGDFTHARGVGEFFRDYIYILEGETIALYFPKNAKPAALFLTLSLDSGGYAAAEHLCKEDHYKAKFCFSENAFQAQFTVTGPRKDYVMESVYKKTQAYKGDVESLDS